MANRGPRYLPTPTQIRREMAKIRKEHEESGRGKVPVPRLPKVCQVHLPDSRVPE